MSVCENGNHAYRHVPLPNSTYLEKCERCGAEKWTDVMSGERGAATMQPGYEETASAFRIKRQGEGWWEFEP